MNYTKKRNIDIFRMPIKTSKEIMLNVVLLAEIVNHVK